MFALNRSLHFYVRPRTYQGSETLKHATYFQTNLYVNMFKRYSCLFIMVSLHYVLVFHHIAAINSDTITLLLHRDTVTTYMF